MRRFLERVREQGGDLGGETGIAAFGLCAHGVEVDEPRFEQGPRDGLKRRAHLPIQLDLVIQRAKDGRDGTLS